MSQYLVTITFEPNGKPYTFKTTDNTLKVDDAVVVETIRGVELGIVQSALEPMEKPNSDIKPIVRKATRQDRSRHKDNQQQAKHDQILIEEAIKNDKLQMEVLETQYTLDKSKLLITYYSEKRVDFRNLLKTLTSLFPCRIELRQIGPREQAKMVGGLGVCGRELCCSQTRGDFDMITISMAKNQLLSLNISKLSGQCGKLKCCLKFENDYYTDARQGLPQIGEFVEYENKRYRVAEFNVVTRTLTLTKSEEIRVITFNDYKQNTKEVSV